MHSDIVLFQAIRRAHKGRARLPVNVTARVRDDEPRSFHWERLAMAETIAREAQR